MPWGYIKVISWRRTPPQAADADTLGREDFFQGSSSRGRRRAQEGGDSGVLVGPDERAVNQTGERLRGFLGNVEQTIDG